MTTALKTSTKRTVAAVVAAATLPLLLASPAAASPTDNGRPGTYELTGDAGRLEVRGDRCRRGSRPLLRQRDDRR